MKNKNYKIKVIKDGPYLVSGNVSLTKERITSDKDGYPIKYITEKHYKNKEIYALCRCGKSKNNPYCDGTHIKIEFDGTETANIEKYLLELKKISGPELILNDFPKLCASARFCTRAGGVRELTKQSDVVELKETAIQEVFNCPSGSLEILDKKTGNQLEPNLKPSISILEDPDKKVSGPIRIKGFIPIESSEKTQYEIRNRVTLCRCGESDNKPFCTGNHITSEFIDSNPIDRYFKIRKTIKEVKVFETGQLYSSGTWQVKRGQVESFKSLWKEFAESALKNRGAIEGALLQEVNNPNSFVSFGLWIDTEATKKWQNSSEFKGFMDRFKDLCDSMQIKILKSIIKVKK